MKNLLTEDYLVEQAAINWLKNLGYSYIHGSELSPENGERESYRHTVLKRRFLAAVRRINPWLTDELAEEVYKRVIEFEHPDFLIKGRIFYELLINGVKLTFKRGKEEKTRIVKIVDFENPENNEFLASNQFTVEYEFEKEIFRRPDLVVFINGLPLAIFEFKGLNAYETARDAFADHKVKREDIPQLYAYAQVLVVSDGLETKYGSPTSDWERFFVWEGILSDADVKVEEVEDGHYRYLYQEKELTSLEVLLAGLFRKEHLLEFVQDFVFYDKLGETYDKKIAIFHQFYSVKAAIEKTKECVLKGETPEDRRIGVVWHTQGTGKSLTMLFYARKALKLKELENPLLLFITDRKNLDEQLHSLFSQMPVVRHAETIRNLREAVKKAAGGIIFATIQKFGKKKAEEYPFLTDRRNIIVIADEAHRSQYRELAQNLRRAIPNASFMGFTATPIELQDRDTYLVFGDSISLYSMDKARRHKVVVPIYYEARLSELHLTNEFIDEEFEEISESMEPDVKEVLKKKYARLEGLILNPERLKKVAQDIVDHFNRRRQDIEGKGMVVTISRKVAVQLFEEIKKHPNAPSVAVVISGSRHKDPPDFWQHLRNRDELEELLNNFKNPERDPKLVIVVDMLLTGFDVPCLHTMYFDKPMKDHSLIQAIARVNRVFKDKPGGLIVDYIGIADNLRKSLRRYTVEAIEQVLSDIGKIINLLKERYDIVASMFAGIAFQNWQNLSPEEIAQLTTQAYNRLSDGESKKNFIKHFVALKKLYALASPHPETIRIKNEIRFWEMIKKMVVKYSTFRIRDISRNMEYEINQLISKSISAEEPIDVFSMLEKGKPEISMLDEKFLFQFKNMEYNNYAADLLAKILNDEIRTRIKQNPFRYRPLSEMLKKLIDKYNVRLITTAEVIDEMIAIAKGIREKQQEGKKLDLTEEELAFYDMLATEKGIFENYEDIKKIAKEVVKELGDYIKVADWNKKEQLRARIKSKVKDMLIKTVNEKLPYTQIDKIATEILKHAELLYAN